MSNRDKEELSLHEAQVFTYAERTVKKYTYRDIVTAARALVPEGMPICINKVSGLQHDSERRYTAVEVSRLSQVVADDSRYYA